MKDNEVKGWNRMVNEGLCYDGNTNTIFPFAQMSKKFGKPWIYYLEAAYFAKDELTDKEFCDINGGVPESFLPKIKAFKP